MAADEPAFVPPARREWVERMAAYLTTQFQWPPVWSRVMAWLLVCEPSAQAAGEIAAAIQASRAALTEPLRALTGYGLLVSSRRPGRKTVYYQMAPDAWRMVLRRRFAALAEFTALAAAGQTLFAPDDPAAARLRETYALFRWLTDEIEPLWERWDALTAEQAAGEP